MFENGGNLVIGQKYQYFCFLSDVYQIEFPAFLEIIIFRLIFIYLHISSRYHTDGISYLLYQAVRPG